jgi:hypothetical protein
MAVSMNKVLAAVYAPESAPALVALARSIVERMQHHPFFPAPTPSLATRKKAVDALQRAEVAPQSVTRGTKPFRNAARHAESGPHRSRIARWMLP